MDTIGSAYCAAYRACLACVILGFFYDADTFEPGLVREHPEDRIERSCVELLVPAVSPVLAVPDVREVTQTGSTAQIDKEVAL
jgi:hypothetical protein